MPAAVAFDYFRWAAAHAHYLLSINHAKNRFTVAQIATFSAPYQVVTRRPCPVWDGYTEEAFLLNGPGLLPRSSRLTAFEAFVLCVSPRTRHQMPRASHEFNWGLGFFFFRC